MFVLCIESKARWICRSILCLYSQWFWPESQSVWLVDSNIMITCLVNSNPKKKLMYELYMGESREYIFGMLGNVCLLTIWRRYFIVVFKYCSALIFERPLHLPPFRCGIWRRIHILWNKIQCTYSLLTLCVKHANKWILCSHSAVST